MGQWGKDVVIDGMKFVPHVEVQGYGDAIPSNVVSAVYIVDSGDKDIAVARSVLWALSEAHVGKPYSEWLHMRASEKMRIEEDVSEEEEASEESNEEEEGVSEESNEEEEVKEVAKVVAGSVSLKVGGWRVPKWGYRVDYKLGNVRVNLAGRLIMWVMGKLTGISESEVTYTLERGKRVKAI